MTQAGSRSALHSQFAGLDNFVYLFTDQLYRDSIGRTVFIHDRRQRDIDESSRLLLAVFADREIGGGLPIERC